MMRIGGRNKIMNSLINKYIAYLMVTKKEFTGDFVPKSRFGKENKEEKQAFSLKGDEN